MASVSQGRRRRQGSFESQRQAAYQESKPKRRWLKRLVACFALLAILVLALPTIVSYTGLRNTVLRLLPRGTHDYAKFVKPSELARMCRDAELTVAGTTGMTYNPLTRVYALGRDTDVNYILHCQKN